MELDCDQLTELECAILDACAFRKRHGWKIVSGRTFEPVTQCCCPLGALFGAETGTSDATSFPGFTDGVDGRNYYFAEPKRDEYIAMGRRFRERLERGEL